VASPEIFSGGRGRRRVQQIQLRTEGRREQSGVQPNLKMGETRILITFLGCIFHGTGNSARFYQNLGIISGGTPPTPLGTPVNATNQDSTAGNASTTKNHTPPPIFVHGVINYAEMTKRIRD
jgi:hypothetical protein